MQEGAHPPPTHFPSLWPHGTQPPPQSNFPRYGPVDMADLKDSSSVNITSHKEELASWIKYDEKDRQVIREKLKTCIDPLNTAGQASALINIVSGHICPDEVNYMMLLTWAKHRWKSMKLVGQRDFTNLSKREFAQ